mmetsp:Transcript_39865/g.71654  ORF Transcript_39865/g.71654 Transcript_39865/m.71654 type:complete len:428 (+) Transcript_39865:63-1346(+)
MMPSSLAHITLLGLLLIGLLQCTDGARLRKQAAKEVKRYRQVLKNHQNVQYYADFRIGGQEISGIFDTGSFEIIVRSSKCGTCKHPTAPFVAKESTSFVANGTIAQHVYGSGPCVTELGYDTVQVGPDMVAKHQAIWEITRHKIDVLNKAKFAAIVGIGPGYGYGSLEETLLMNYNINEFSICLDKRSQKDGMLHWGPLEKELPRDQVFEAKVYGQHHWSTRMTSIGFNTDIAKEHKGALDPCATAKGCSVIIDSGTSLIAGPAKSLLMLQQQIGEIKEDCSNLHELPTLRFTLDGHEMELPPQAYVMRLKGHMLDSSIWELLFFKPKFKKVDMCAPAFMDMDMGSSKGADVWIMGMPFFRYYHSTFDLASKAMRFAKAGPDCEALPVVHSQKDASLINVDVDAYSPLDVDVDMLIPPFRTVTDSED